jgi:hypothetical protein
MPSRQPSQAVLTAVPAPTLGIPLPWTLITLLGALLLTVGAVIALAHPILLVPPASQITEAVCIYAGYLASRNLALAIMLVALLVLRARLSLAHLMALVALIQFIDAVIDAAEARWAIVPGLLLLGLLFLLAATRLAGRQLWKHTASTA